MNKSIPPFYVGQKVVATESSEDRMIVKGGQYTIRSVAWKCCKWLVDVGNKIPSGFRQDVLLCGCGSTFKSSGIQYAQARYFRAITEDMQAITYSEVMERELICVN